MISMTLIHGFTGLSESWNGVLERLPGGVQYWTPQVMGHGATPALAEVHGFEQEVERLAAELRQHGFLRGMLCGYSLGGRLALGLALRHPELCSALVLIGAHPGLGTEPERQTRRATDAQWVALLETKGLNPFLKQWEEQPLFASQRALPEAVQQTQARLRRSHTALGLAAALRALSLAEMPDYRTRLSELAMPVHWVAGSLDAKFTALAQDAAQRCPHGQFHPIDGAGHNPVLERPDAIASLLQRVAQTE